MLNTTLLDGTNDVSQCGAGTIMPRICITVGSTICNAALESYTCTEDDLVNATTRAIVTFALNDAVSKLQMLLVNRNTSSDLRNSTNCELTSFISTSIADHVVFVSMRPGVFATGVICKFSSDDGRPLTSSINIPPAATSGTTTAVYGNALRLLAQVLGFDYTAVDRYLLDYSSRTTYYVGNPTLYPNGPLKVVGPDGRSPSTAVTVPAGTILADDARQYIVNKNGEARLVMTSPNVQRVARNHFKCDTMLGALLEEFVPDIMRWERRQLNFEVLGSEFEIPTATPILSNFTMAAFQDMGFYDVDYTVAATILPTYNWGKGRGCDFVEGCSIIQWGDMFCNGSYGTGYDLTYWAACQYEEFLEPLDPPYRHLPQTPAVGGNDEYADYCPYVGFLNSNMPTPELHTCTSDSTDFTIDETTSEEVCPSCRAMRRNVYNQSFLPPSAALESDPACMEVACLNLTHAAVRVGDRYFVCAAGDTLELTYAPTNPTAYKPITSTPWLDYRFTGTILCPDTTNMCNLDMGSVAAYKRESSTNAVLNSATWPTIVSIQPPYSSVEGGDVITVTGRNLAKRTSSDLSMACNGLWIGGVATVWESYQDLGRNTTSGYDVFTVNTSATPQASGDDGQLAGTGSDGAGVVDVALLCRVSGVLQCTNMWSDPRGYGEGYCAISTIRSGFTYVSVPPPPPETYFLSDTTNQIIVVVLVVIILGILLVIIYWFCNSTYAPPDVVEKVNRLTNDANARNAKSLDSSQNTIGADTFAVMDTTVINLEELHVDVDKIDHTEL